jgi:hypothetical protein
VTLRPLPCCVGLQVTALLLCVQAAATGSKSASRQPQRIGARSCFNDIEHENVVLFDGKGYDDRNIEMSPYRDTVTGRERHDQL